MSNWKIVITGTGPSLSGSSNDADEGARYLVAALKERGHKIDSAEFSGNGKLPVDISAHVITGPEPTPALIEALEDERHPQTVVAPDNYTPGPGAELVDSDGDTEIWYEPSDQGNEAE